jgi:1,5-anhydro-D-fructose reductase (1,5-anhydro-D-mannitol-forming)
MVSNNKIQLAICGLGGFAKRRVLPALLSCNAVELVAVVDRSPAESGYLSNVACFKSLDELLDSSLAEAVYLCTPNYLHHSQTVQCLRAGRHVFCEKPMATNSRDCDSMLLLAKKLKLQLSVGHMMRFSPGLQVAREWVQSGKMGALRSVDLTFHYDLPESKRPWAFRKDLSGGGALIDAGVHCIDAVRFLIGGPIVAIDAQFDVLVPDGVERTAVCTLTAGDVLCTLSVCSNAPYSSNLVIRGTDGVIDVESFAATWGGAILKFVSSSDSKYNDELVLDVSGIYARQLQAFAETILSGRIDYRSAVDALENISVVENFYRISRQL